MYPTISHLLKDLFGIDIPLPIATFGFFLIIAIYTAGWVLGKELKRRRALGQFTGHEETFVENAPPTTNEILLACLWSFLIGYKFVEAFAHYGDLVADPQKFILSSRGSFSGGVVFALFTGFTRFLAAQKLAEKKQTETTRVVEPEERVSTIMMIAGLTGILGSKIAHNLEHVDKLIEDPIGQLLAFTGLSFYGGLILGTACVLWYARQKNMSSIRLLDATSPALILAYGVGRIGCQLSGDGDWGIENTAPKPDSLSFLPDWAWSFTYPNNVLSAGDPIPGCVGKYCSELSVPVYPTPIYEIAMCLVIFGILWSLRRHLKAPGLIFGVYLMLNGIERFLIEQIRVNPPYSLGGIEATQAELIAVSLFLGGIVTLIFSMRKKETPQIAEP